MSKTTSIEKRPHSFFSRYVFTLLVNFFKIAVGLVNASIVPKALGPTSFGNYQFLLISLKNIRNLLHFNTSNAFFTYSSKEEKVGTAFYIYFGWQFIQILLVFAFLFCVQLLGVTHTVFPDQQPVYIYSIAGLEFLNFFTLSLVSFGESKSANILVQSAVFASHTVRVTFLLLLFFGNYLNLVTFIILNYIASTIIVVWVVVLFVFRNRDKYLDGYKRSEQGSVLRYFVAYCGPLVVSDVLGSGANYFERWFLQLVYGSAKQAFYSLAFQWITIIFLFSQSISKLLWKDIAYHFHSEEKQRVQNVLEKTYNNIFTISLLFSIILINYRLELIELTVGKAFTEAQPIIVILAIYAIFYNVSQVNSVYFYATAQVKLMRNLRMLNIFLRFVLAYFLLAPRDYAVPGLSLGAVGLALQGTIACLLMTAIELFFVSRKVSISLKAFLHEKALLSFVVVCTAFGCHALVELLSLSTLNRFMLGNGLFFTLTGVIACTHPPLFGFKKQEFRSYAKKLKEMLPGLAKSR